MIEKEEKCNECKDKIYRVYLNVDTPYDKNIILGSLINIGISKIQAESIVSSLNNNSLPALIYSGEKKDAFKLVDKLIENKVDVTITDSIKERKWLK